MIDEISVTADGWEDAARGFTGARPGNYRGMRSTLQELSDLYDTDWLARRIVDIVPDHIFRGGVQISELDRSEARTLNSDQKYPGGVLQHAAKMARLHGGSIIAMIPERGDLQGIAAPANGFLNLHVIPYKDCSVVIDRDSNSRSFGSPKTFTFTVPLVASTITLDSSRVVVFEGLTRSNPTIHQPWLSVLEPCFDAIANFGFSWASVSDLIKEASIMWMKMRNLTTNIARSSQTQSVEDALTNRLTFNAKTKSIMRMLYLDSEGEDVGRVSVSFTDLPTLMQEMALLIAGAANLPVTKLFGRAPAGMNATGESDLINFSDMIEAERTWMRDKISKYLLLRTGKQLEFSFAPLSVPTPEQSASLRKLLLEGDTQIWNMGGLDALELLVARLRDGSIGLNLSEDRIQQLEDRLAKLIASEGVAPDVDPTATDPTA